MSATVVNGFVFYIECGWQSCTQNDTWYNKICTPMFYHQGTGDWY